MKEKIEMQKRRAKLELIYGTIFTTVFVLACLFFSAWINIKVFTSPWLSGCVVLDFCVVSLSLISGFLCFRLCLWLYSSYRGWKMWKLAAKHFSYVGVEAFITFHVYIADLENRRRESDEMISKLKKMEEGGRKKLLEELKDLEKTK